MRIRQGSQLTSPEDRWPGRRTRSCSNCLSSTTTAFSQTLSTSILTFQIMSNESISNKVGNATDGAVGQQTLLNEAQTVASHATSYVAGVVGLGGNKAATSTEDAANNKQGGVTLGSLVNETRDLAAHALHTVQDVVAGGAAKVQEGAENAEANASPQAQGYVEKARSLAASGLQTAENLIASGQKKAEEVANDANKSSTTQDAKQGASNLADSAQQTANNAANKVNEATKA